MGESRSDAGIAMAWDALAESWGELQGEAGDGNQKWIINPALFALLGDVEGRSVLDAACGGGHVARALARRGARVTAVDISSGMVALARRSPESSSLDVQYRVADIADIREIADASFDAAVCSMALMNVAAVDKACSEFARLLRERGRLVFSIPHPCYPRVKGGRGVSRQTDDGEDWLEYYAVESYQDEGRYEVEIPDAAGRLQSVPTYHRTLSSYVAMLTAAGFAVDGLLEPRPLDVPEAKQELGASWWDATNRIPYWLVVRARLLS